MRSLIPFLVRFGKLAVQKGLSLALGFLTLTVLTGHLEPIQMGAYFALLSAAGILATPFNGTVMPFLVGEAARPAASKAGRLKGLVLGLATTALLYVVLLHFGAPVVVHFFGTGFSGLENFVPLIVLSLALNALVSSALLGSGKLVLSQVGDSVVRPVALMGVVLLLAHFSGLNTETALAAVVVAQLLSITVTTAVVARRFRVHQTPPLNPLRPGIASTYFRHLLNAAAASLQVNAPTIIVASVALSSSAYYALAQKIVGLLAVAGSLIGIANSKAYADMAANGRKIEAGIYFNRMIYSSLIIILPPVALWLMVDHLVIRHAFGPQYVDEVSTVIILLIPAHLAFSLMAPVIIFLYGIERQHSVFYLQVGASVLLLGLGWWLSQNFGARGMAIAYSVSQVCLYSAMYALFRRETTPGSAHA